MARLRTAHLVVIALLVGACAAGASPSSRSAGPASPAASSTSSPSASRPTPMPAPAVVALPDRLLGDWLADVDPIKGLGPHADRIQVSFDWDGGRRVWVQHNLGDRLSLHSAPVASDPGEIRLVTAGPGTGCAQGDEGRYAWERPGDGAFLHLTLIEDACALRAAALARTWVRSLGAVNDGGRGVINSFDPAVEVTLPADRFGMSGWHEAPDIHTIDPAGPLRYLIAVRNPMGFAAPCSPTDREAMAVGPTTQAFVQYLRDLPGVDLTVAEAEIDGRPASRLSLTLDGGTACESGEVALYGPPRPSADGYWAMVPGTPVSLWLVDVDSDLYLFEYGGEGITAADETRVMATVRFLERLPAG